MGKIIAHKNQTRWLGPIKSTSKFDAEVKRFNDEIDECASVVQLDECIINNNEIWRQMLLDMPDDCKEYNMLSGGETTGMHIKRVYYMLKQNEEFKGDTNVYYGK